MGRRDRRGPGCWNCGSSRHHHRDCDSGRRRSQTGCGSNSQTPTAKNSAIENEKRYGYTCRRNYSKRSPTPKGKWMVNGKVKTVNGKDTPLLPPRELISTGMGKSLYILEEIGKGLDSIGEISTANRNKIMEEVIKLEDKLRWHWNDIDDLLAHAKNYQRMILDAAGSKPERNTCDELFKQNLEKIDKKRQDLWACCGQRIVTLRKIGEIMDDVTPKLTALFAEIEDGHKLFRDGEATPTFYDLEVLTERMMEPYSLLKECRGQVNKLETLCSATDVREKLELIQESIDLIQEKRRAALRQQLLPERRC